MASVSQPHSIGAALSSSGTRSFLNCQRVKTLHTLSSKATAAARSLRAEPFGRPASSRAAASTAREAVCKSSDPIAVRY